MAKLPGSVWVSGANLHFVNDSGVEYYYTGSSGGTISSALPGSIWVEGYNLCYIDANRVKRILSSYSNTNVTAIAGSLWVNNYIRWVTQHGTHTYAYQNSHSNYSHSDSPYTNRAHSDRPSHSDIVYQDHKDGCGPGYIDYSDHYNNSLYSDTWRMGAYPVYTNHSDASRYTDCYYNNYTKTFGGSVPHSDTPGYNDSHSDVPSYNDHSDLPKYVGP